MRRILAGLAVLALLAVGALYMQRGPLALAVMKRTVSTAMATDVIKGLPDGLHVAVCGSGGPLPDGDRGGPCTAVIAGKRLFLVDTGDGAGRTLGRMGVGDPNGVVLLTHFHSDHIDGLGNVALQRWAGFNAATRLKVYGTTGVERVVAGFNEAYALDAGYRTAHHGEPVAPSSGAGMEAHPIVFPAGVDQVVVLEEDGVKVTAFLIDHGPIKPAVGYRFDYKGRSVVVSGDTAPSAVLTRMSKGVDLLVHEAQSTELVNLLNAGAKQAGNPKRAKIFDDILNYHTSPEAAAGIASKAGVKTLLLTHIIPPLPLRALEIPFLGDSRKIFSGRLWIARDGDLVSLPAGGTAAATRTNLLH
jgi:ribonuclease Z